MFLEYDEEFIQLSETYEETFKEEFPSYVYGVEKSKELIRACLREGKPYDLKNDPDFDPEADY